MKIFTNEKSFVKGGVIGSPVLNKLGLHVFRVVLAHYATRFRMMLLARSMPRHRRQQFYRDGYILIEDFLPPKLFYSLREEFFRSKFSGRKTYNGSSRINRVGLNKSQDEALPILKKVRKLLIFDRYTRYCSSWNKPVESCLQLIQSQAADGIDNQTALHSDSFYPTMKFWLTLKDSDENNMPLHYVRGSNQLSWQRLIWEYRKSLVAHTYTDTSTELGAFQVRAEELDNLGLSSPEKIEGKANSLLIINGAGFYKYQENADKGARCDVFGFGFRGDNPFQLLPW
jgi:hypothetical protein